MDEPKPPSRDAFEREASTDLKDDTPDAPKGMLLHTKILIGLIVGVVVGFAVNLSLGSTHPSVIWTVDNITEPVGRLFLRLLLMVVVPLVFTAIVVGVAGLRDMGAVGAPARATRNLRWPGLALLLLAALLGYGIYLSTGPLARWAIIFIAVLAGTGMLLLAVHAAANSKLGRVGLKTLAFTLIFSTLSVVIGLTLANIIKPGTRIDPATAVQLQERYGAEAVRRVETVQTAQTAKPSPLMQVINTMVPANPVFAVASESPNFLHLIFFAAIIGVAATMVGGAAAQTFLTAMQGLFDIMAKVVDLIMKMAPYAVAALLFNNTARFGLDLMTALMWFVLTVLLGLALHCFGVFSLAVYFLAKIPPLEFFRRSKTAMLTAFSTSSSNATLPTSLKVAEQNLGVPRQISGFVMTVGATINMNGTTLYEGLTVLFLAQLSGLDLALSTQIMLIYLAVLGGVGAAGIPGGSIPLLIAILAQIGVNPALIAVVLGVDRILDMARTTVNVTGDLVAATYIARSEGFPLLGSPPPEKPAP